VQRIDAAIMEGTHLEARAVASIEGIARPITAARMVMEDTNHVLLEGPPATRFAQHGQLELLLRARSPRRSSGRSPRASTVAAQTMHLNQAMLKSKRTQKDRYGTVGAVALDRSRTVAAGASTGSIDSMLPGRVGDNPLIGCGVFADNQSDAVSRTGIGEGIIRLVTAKSICDHLAMGRALRWPLDRCCVCSCLGSVGRPGP
jgi:beta-aspartyl-peptidase (threonine type)